MHPTFQKNAVFGKTEKRKKMESYKIKLVHKCLNWKISQSSLACLSLVIYRQKTTSNRQESDFLEINNSQTGTRTQVFGVPFQCPFSYTKQIELTQDTMSAPVRPLLMLHPCAPLPPSPSTLFHLSIQVFLLLMLPSTALWNTCLKPKHRPTYRKLQD